MKIKNIENCAISAGSTVFFTKHGRRYEGILRETIDPSFFTATDSIPIIFKGKPKELLPKYINIKRGRYITSVTEEYTRIARVTKKTYKNVYGAHVFDAKLIWIKNNETGTVEKIKKRRHGRQHYDWWKEVSCYNVDRVYTKEEIEQELFCEAL